MPMRAPRNRARASSFSRFKTVPSTVTVPEFGRSSPAIAMSKVDLPEPDGPVSPTASPRAMVKETFFRIWTRAAPRPRLKSMSSNMIAASSIIASRLCLALAVALALSIPAVFGLLAPAQAAAKAIKIVAFGDSLTAGYLLPADAAFPAVLEKALRRAGDDVRIVNAGVSGDTAEDGLARLDWALADGADGVILELGANDMLRGLDPAHTRQTLADARRDPGQSSPPGISKC